MLLKLNWLERLGLLDRFSSLSDDSCPVKPPQRPHGAVSWLRACWFLVWRWDTLKVQGRIFPRGSRGMSAGAVLMTSLVQEWCHHRDEIKSTLPWNVKTAYGLEAAGHLRYVSQPVDNGKWERPCLSSSGLFLQPLGFSACVSLYLETSFLHLLGKQPPSYIWMLQDQLTYHFCRILAGGWRLPVCVPSALCFVPVPEQMLTERVTRVSCTSLPMQEALLSHLLC